jgi:hypothetical protein
MNRPHEALRLLEGIEWGHGWWRNLSVRFETTCAAHHVLGSHETELLAGLDARARFPGSLEAIGAEARARAALGQSDLVLGLVDEALTLPGGLTSPDGSRPRSSMPTAGRRRVYDAPFSSG